MLLAIAFTFEARICVVFVDSLSFEMREPRLNVAGWDEDRHSLTCLTSFIAHFGASVFDLSYSADDVTYTPFETGVTATGDGSNIADLTQAFASPITTRYIKLTYVSTGQPYSDTIYTFGVFRADAVTYPAVLHPGNDGDVLTLVGGLPAWVTP